MANYLTYAPSATFDELLQLLPVWRESRLVELGTKADAAVGFWDAHMESCVECLTWGEHLCTEGLYLTQDVVQRRSAFGAYRARGKAAAEAPTAHPEASAVAS
jgi:hypothetical protein